jgi:uncharacterized membrane protein YbaN (DUF454 family)
MTGPRPRPRFGLSARPLWFALGWLFFAVGLVGAFLPVLPTTPFMILALWAFARSSERFHGWLYRHRIFGPPLQRWQEHRVIPTQAKAAAIGGMALSLGYMAFFTDAPPAALLAAGALMAVGAGYVLTKPGRPPNS